MDAVIDISEEVKDPHRKGQALILKGLYVGLAGRPRSWPGRAVPWAGTPVDPHVSRARG